MDQNFSTGEQSEPRVAQDQETPKPKAQKLPDHKALTSSYYGLLGVHPSASVREIRQAYRALSKSYHPDTTSLPGELAVDKFQKINEAYATLSNPERRTVYDQRIGYSRVAVVQTLPSLKQPASRSSKPQSSSAYLDPTDRPLSAGEIFALFILGLTFLACLVLAIAIGMTRGDAVFTPETVQGPTVQQIAPAQANIQGKVPLNVPALNVPALTEPSASVFLEGSKMPSAEQSAHPEMLDRGASPAPHFLAPVVE